MFRRLRSILAGLDGSSYTDSVTKLAVDWAKSSDAYVAGIAVIDRPGLEKPSAAPMGAFGFAEHSAETVLQNERRRIEQILSQFALRCADAQTACREIEAEGAPVEQILHEAQRTDLVILGSETFFEYGSETADATAEDVLRHSPRPVVCVPKELPDCKNCIVVAYDGSLQAARALHAFWACGIPTGRTVHIVSIAHEYIDAAKAAQVAAEFLHLHKIEATTHAIATYETPGKVILDRVKEWGAELLVMGAYGQPRLREFIIGSVTQYLLKRSPAPVFVSH